MFTACTSKTDSSVFFLFSLLFLRRNSVDVGVLTSQATMLRIPRLLTATRFPRNRARSIPRVGLQAARQRRELPRGVEQPRVHNSVGFSRAVPSFNLSPSTVSNVHEEAEFCQWVQPLQIYSRANRRDSFSARENFFLPPGRWLIEFIPSISIPNLAEINHAPVSSSCLVFSCGPFNFI